MDSLKPSTVFYFVSDDEAPYARFQRGDREVIVNLDPSNYSHIEFALALQKALESIPEVLFPEEI